jgi:hypothetical protein
MIVLLLPIRQTWQKASAQSAPDAVHFAIIGDYGTGGAPAAAVADLVKSWNPDFVVTTGDNNYPDGAASTIDSHVGKYYHDFIYPYSGKYGPGADRNRFFPTLGNHDWHTPGVQPYLDYFTLPGNERYYDVQWGPVQLFIVDSDPSEPDGITADSVQANWLKAQLAASEAPWKLVFEHHPPFSSGLHGSTPDLQWPFQEWGATAVFSGHEHSYERLIIDGFPYFINGLGGASSYTFKDALPGSVVRYNAAPGAIRVDATAENLTIEFFSTADPTTPVDTYAIDATTGTSIDVTAPTSTPAAVTDRVVTTEADARVEAAKPDTNFGKHTTLRIDGGNDPDIESYLRFRVGSTTQPVQHATLRLFTSTDSQSGFSVYTTMNDWVESGAGAVTWTTRPPQSEQAIASLDAAPANTWVEIDVTSIVTGGGVYSFVLATNNTDGLTMSSREGDNPPQLVLTF